MIQHQVMPGETVYSFSFRGDRGNFGHAVKFDATDGYIGISQLRGGNDCIDRVLLTPSQFEALVKFVKHNGQPLRKGSTPHE